MPGRKNTDQALYMGSNPGTQYAFMHGPFENFGVFNGQFEQGPSGAAETDPPEGWLYTPIGAGGTFLRTTGGYAGNWCARGGQAAAGVGVNLFSQKYLPVAEPYVYAFQMAAGQTANGTIRPGLLCYDANKALIGPVFMAAAFIPASIYPAWTLYNYFCGGRGAAFAAGTRYIRVLIRLQLNAALANAYTYVDDVKLQQVQPWLWAQIP